MLELLRSHFDLWFIIGGVLIVIDGLLFVASRRRVNELRLANANRDMQSAPTAEKLFAQYNRFVLYRRFLDVNDGRLAQLGYGALFVRIGYFVWIAFGLWLIFGVRQ